MRRRTALSVLLVTLTALTGCSSLHSPDRDTPPQHPEVAPNATGVQADGTVFCYELIVCPLVTAVELPGAASRDTP